MTAPRILGIDGSSHLGWAYGTAGERPVSGSFLCAVPGSSRAAVFSGAGRWITKFLTDNPVDILAIEAPLPGSFTQGQTNMRTSEILVGIPAVLEFMAFQMKVYRHERINQSSVKKHFVRAGKGDQKEAIKQKCLALGWVSKTDDDQSYDRTDALAVWSYAESVFAGKFAQAVDGLFLDSERKKREAEERTRRSQPSPIPERF